MGKKLIRPIVLITGSVTLLLITMALWQLSMPQVPTSEAINLAMRHGWQDWTNAAEAKASSARLALSLLLAGTVLMAGALAPWKPRLALSRAPTPRFTRSFSRPGIGLEADRSRSARRYVLLMCGGLIWIAGIVSALPAASRPAVALSAYINDAPNIKNAIFNTSSGTCGACHGFNNAKHPVGQHPESLAFALAGGTLKKAWHNKPGAAHIDSDGDGFTNGEELQDPGATWVYDENNNAYGPYQDYLSNPSEVSSVPPAPQVSNISGIANGQTLSGSLVVNVSLRYAGLSKVVYSFKDSNGVEVLKHTVNSTPTSNYANNFCLANGSSSTAGPANCPAWNSTVLPNGVYSLVVTAYDRRANAQGGPQTGSLTRTNLTVNNQTSHNPTVFSDDRSDNGNCTLREAIIAANTNSQVDLCLPGNPGPDTIQLQAGTYQLSLPGPGEEAAATGDLDITEALTLIGQGDTVTIIDGGSLDRVFDLPQPNNPSVNFSKLTIRNGKDLNQGSGGLYVPFLSNSTINLAQVTVISNTGYGIHNAGTMTLDNVKILNNTSTGLYSTGDNPSPVTITRSTISGNQEGGIFIVNSGQVTLIESVVNNNTNGGDGGGITVISVTPNPLTVVNSTISGNKTDGNGGGIYHLGGTANLYNATIVWNTANSDGAGGDSGGGIYYESGTVNFQNTILANNVRDTGIINLFQDCVGPLNSGGYNLLRVACTLTGDTTGNKTGVDPKLGSFQNNGGPTKTYGLNADSPAVDAGNPNGCKDQTNNTLAVDQRGYLRPAGGRCDMGAFEFGAVANTPPTISNIADKSILVNTSTGPIGFTVGDVETSPGSLTVGGSSSNQNLVPDANIVFGGSGANRTVTITPAADQTGSAVITISVSDGLATSNDTFVLTVNPEGGGGSDTHLVFLPIIFRP